MTELIHFENPSPNWNERELPISMVVLHYTGMPSGAEALERMCSEEGGVSAHYMIDEDGTVHRLVREDRRAWHAGKSFWRGITDINSASIGIELVNPGHEWGYRPFPDAQMEALLPLLADMVQRHDIPRANVVGHSDIAPTRKDDPGELFDWDLLAAHRLALRTPRVTMPSPFENDGAFFLGLERWGYDISDPQAAMRAFQRRWRPHIIDGVVDGECSAILFSLLLDRDSGKTR
ncbi:MULTISPECIES: N-acetylmuramoyl-L-alanine amidase [unclassified Novosphingobium]|uniref:N-acetylmuramoyl-L-alanine amidase n=1 Tax=unclassified Novosphingobium TaxID=2644732 RepID=UPI0025EC8424|nr:MULTISPECIES: N-acetylmuramoyl-L-alanine amidase [unclassified Novosphingobium]HQV03538.1 N-acetylmuramoyl-L-alanine amidase [Novosphingobium sp.]